MSENRILYSKAPPLPDGTSQEAQLRQALELMGGRRTAPISHGTTHQGRSQARSGATPQRHRYVRDGEIPVVHVALGRQNARQPDPTLQHDKALIESMRQELEQERSARESAERAVAEGRHAMTALQTRLAHLEMDLQAAQEQAAAQQALLEEARQTPELVVSLGRPPTATTRHRDTSPKVRSVKVGRKSQPKPVKWWVRSD